MLSIFLTFFKVGLFTIGGGYAMIPVIQDAVCKKRGWLSDEEFLDSISLTNSLPGPLATNAATFIGYRIKGIAGSAAAVLGTVSPSIIIILAIATAFDSAAENAYVQAFFRGAAPAVFALLVSAVFKLGKSAGIQKDMRSLAAAAASFAAIALLGVNPIIVVVVSAAFALFADRPAGSDGGGRE